MPALRWGPYDGRMEPMTIRFVRVVAIEDGETVRGRVYSKSTTTRMFVRVLQQLALKSSADCYQGPAGYCGISGLTSSPRAIERYLSRIDPSVTGRQYVRPLR